MEDEALVTVVKQRHGKNEWMPIDVRTPVMAASGGCVVFGA